MDVRGQGALEYLLLIGGAVLVAAIVIALITGIPTTGPNPEDSAYCASLTAVEASSPGTCVAGCPPNSSTTAGGACALTGVGACYFDPNGTYPVGCP